MAGRRPRLVHEGSPLIDGSEYSATGVNNNFHHLSSLDASTSNPQSQSLGALQLVESEKSVQNKGKEFKLKTSLVIGERTVDEKDDQDDVMMDSDDNLYQGSSTSLSYTTHGSVCHGRVLEHINNNPGQRMAIDALHHHQEIQQYPTNLFYNNNVQCNNVVTHLAPTSNPLLPSIYHMPSPLTSPLVVLDGANIAYNYSESLNPMLSQNSTSLRRQPDPRGIRVVIEYFLKHNCRVQAVVPTSWYQLKPRPGDTYHLKNRTRGDSDAKMVTDEVEELRHLRQQGFLVAIPPGDDDDAYALALARREEDRLIEQQEQQQQQLNGSSNHSTQQHHLYDGMDEDDNLTLPLPLGGFVVSNDMFHDAIRRDENRQFHQQQHVHSIPLSARPVSLKSWLSKKRISYSFANVGSRPSDVGDDGDNTIRLDFIPNPRNVLIDAIDARGRLRM